jgi:hypothetical protein
MRDRVTPQIGRRGILGLVAVGVAAAATAAALRAHHVEKVEEKHEADEPRYRVTPHVEAFYRVNRY